MKRTNSIRHVGVTLFGPLGPCKGARARLFSPTFYLCLKQTGAAESSIIFWGEWGGSGVGRGWGSGGGGASSPTVEEHQYQCELATRLVFKRPHLRVQCTRMSMMIA